MGLGERVTIDRRRWIMLITLCIGQLMIVLDATVVNVALPTIQAHLHFAPSSIAWVINAYLITFGGLLLLAGRMGDLIGRTRVFLTGLAAFVVSSMLCGAAPSALILVIARFVQGSSAAMVSSMVLGIISPMFPAARERTLALSVFAFVAMGGSTLGLVAGGAITQLLDWRWIFFINAPVGIAALAVGWRMLDRDAGLGIGAGADLGGAVLVTSTPMLAVYGMIYAGSHGWGSFGTVGSLIGSVVLGASFFLLESRVATPLVPLTIFRHRNLVSAAIVRMIFPIGAFGFNFIGALYLQHVLHYSPLQTGLAYLPGTICTAVLSLAITPMLTRRFSPKALVVAGLIVLTAGIFTFGLTISLHERFLPTILVSMMLQGTGFGLLFMPSISLCLAGVAASESGVASGLANVAVQIGASIGVALLATVAASRTANLSHGHSITVANLTGGYRLALFVASGATALSILAALILLTSQQRPTVTTEELNVALAH